jgi:hypothetical protein
MKYTGAAGAMLENRYGSGCSARPSTMGAIGDAVADELFGGLVRVTDDVDAEMESLEALRGKEKTALKRSVRAADDASFRRGAGLLTAEDAATLESHAVGLLTCARKMKKEINPKLNAIAKWHGRSIADVFAKYGTLTLPEEDLKYDSSGAAKAVAAFARSIQRSMPALDFRVESVGLRQYNLWLPPLDPKQRTVLQRKVGYYQDLYHKDYPGTTIKPMSGPDGYRIIFKS